MKHCLCLIGIVLILSSKACKKNSIELNYALSSPVECLQLDSLIIDFCCSGGLSVQKDKIPGNVIDLFHENFPGAYSEEWLFYGGIYGVRFELDYIVNRALYMLDEENNVDMLAYIVNLQKSQIPVTVTTAVKEQYGDAWAVNRAYEIQTFYHIIYELIIEQRSDEITVFFNENGGFLGGCPF